MPPRRVLLALSLFAAALTTPASLLAQAGKTDWNAVGQRLLRDMQRAGEDAAGEALAQWIWASRRDALSAGVQPMPQAIRARLRGYFPDALLARVRYRIGNGHDLSLQTNAFKGNAVAITLGDVILFRPDAALLADARLWAHELTHVQQYDRWGVRGFARRYTLDHVGVEREAEAGAARYAQANKARPGN
ncbi:eCIS core domain-containing protein [Sphingobium nicotianae]|uniref:DUF4157 domain-containing protein n=1 Tax=Sphingobium nicotianae TaxID=2782607 RepID=A0A9X1ITG7_9SPHN|nr:DUF4157 domain-containing protein [Sphingobium nicotianae]MBT2189209.1 DUF4157 domain-containing protein [Sphingobium nicotianae]